MNKDIYNQDENGIEQDLMNLEDTMSSEASDVEVYNRQEQEYFQDGGEPIMEYPQDDKDNSSNVASPNKKKKIVIYGIIAAVLLAAGGAGFVVLNKQVNKPIVQVNDTPEQSADDIEEVEQKDVQPTTSLNTMNDLSFDSDEVKPIVHEEVKNLRENAFDEFEKSTENKFTDIVTPVKEEVKIEPVVVAPETNNEVKPVEQPFVFEAPKVEPTKEGEPSVLPTTTPPTPVFTPTVATNEVKVEAKPFEQPVLAHFEADKKVENNTALQDKERQIEYLRIENNRLQQQLESANKEISSKLDSRVEDEKRVSNMLKERLEDSVARYNDIRTKYEKAMSDYRTLKTEFSKLVSEQNSKNVANNTQGSVISKIDNQSNDIKNLSVSESDIVIKPRKNDKSENKVIKPATSIMATQPEVVIKEKLIVVGEEKVVPEPKIDQAKNSPYKVNEQGQAVNLEEGKIEAISNGVVWLKIKGEYKVYRNGDKIPSGRIIGLVDDKVGVFDNENVLIWKK